MSVLLRDYQLAMQEQARDLYRRGERSVLLQLATGGGKSQIAASITKKAVDRGHRVFWITHRRELIRQVCAAYKSWGIEYGVIAAGTYPRPSASVQVCSLDTLRRRPSVPEPKLIIWDEARHLGAATWRLVYDRWPAAWHCGLDATPQRNDGRGLAAFFQHMVRGPPMQELIDRGYLASYRIFAPVTPDTSGLHTRAGEYITSELESMFDRPTVVGNAIDHYQKFANGKKALAFCVSIRASQHLAAAFRDAGYAAVHIDGETDASVRDLAMKEFDEGKLQIICSVQLYTEGLDIVGVETILQMRPTQSRALYLQMIGRGLRPAPNKQECIIIDACANYVRHGLPTDPYDWQLTYDERKRKAKRTVSVRVCPHCFAASSSRATVCSNCGVAFPVQPRQIEERAGELTEITREMVALRLARREQGRARSLEELQEFGRRKGYAPGWARIVWQARQRKLA